MIVFRSEPPRAPCRNKSCESHRKPNRGPVDHLTTSQSRHRHRAPLDWWQFFNRSESVFNSGISAKTSCEAQIGGSLCALLSSVDLYGCCDRLVGLESGIVFASGRERERVWAWRRLEGRRTRSRWCFWGRVASAKHRWCCDTARTNSTTNTSPPFRWASLLNERYSTLLTLYVWASCNIEYILCVYLL